MAAFDYLESRADAEELLAEFGQTGAIRRQAASGPAHDPVLTPTDYPATLVVDPDGWQQSETTGTLIQMSDAKVYVSTAGLSIEPTVADQIVMGGAPLDVVAVKPLSPAGTLVMWTIAARG